MCNPIYIEKSDASLTDIHISHPGLQWFRDLKYVEVTSQVSSSFDYNSEDIIACHFSDDFFM